MSSNNNPKDEKEEKDKKDGWLSFLWEKLNPLSHLGSIFTLVLVGVAAWFLSKNEKVREWFHDLGKQDWVQKLLGGVADLVGKISPEMGAGLRAKLGIEGGIGDYLETQTAETAKTNENITKNFSPAMLGVLTKTPENWKDFVAIAKEANCGKLTRAEDFKNPDTMIALVTKRPDMVKDLLKAIRTSSDAGDKELFTSLITGAKKMINGPLFDSYFGKDTRPATLAMLAKLSADPKDPSKAMTAAQLEMGLKQMGMVDANGAPTPALKKAMGKVVDDFASGKMQDLDFNGLQKSLMGGLDLTTNKTALKTVIDTGMPQIQAAVGKENAQPFRAAFGDKKLFDFAQATTGQSDAAKAAYLMRPESLPNLMSFAQTAKLDALPATLRPQLETLKELAPARKELIEASKNLATVGKTLLDLQPIFAQKGKDVPDASFIVAQMLKPHNRALIQKAGTANVAKIMATMAPAQAGLLTAHNLDVLCNATAKIDGASPKGTQFASSMLVGLVDLETGTNTNFARMNDKTIAAFFSNPKYNEAVHDMLVGLKGFTGANAIMLSTMANNWWAGNDRHHGIGAVLADPEKGAAFMRDAMNPNKKSDWLESAAASLSPSMALSLKGGSVADNKEYILNLKNAKDLADGMHVSPNVNKSGQMIAATNSKGY